MRLLHASDFHGSPRHYERLVSLAGQTRPDVVVLGGDLFPDEHTLDPSRGGREQPGFVRRPFRDWMRRVCDAVPGVQIAIVFGNHDWLPAALAAEELAAELPLHVLDRWTRGGDRVRPGADPAAVDAPRRAVEIAGVHFVGYSCTPPTPWAVKDFERLDRPQDAIPRTRRALRWDTRAGMAIARDGDGLFRGGATMESELAAAPPAPGPIVLVTHCPPHGSALDVAYDRRPLGSHSVLAAIERMRPIVSLHGHIHESPRMSESSSQRIGATLAVNAGRASEYLLAALLTIDAGGASIELIPAELAP